VLSLGFLRRVAYRPLDLRAPWGLDVKAANRAILYLVARGRTRLEVKGQPVIELAAGNAAFLPRGAPHVLRDAATTRPQEWSPTTRPCRLGGRGHETAIVAAFFERDREPPSLLERPMEVVVLAEDASPIIELVRAELEQPGPASALLLQRLTDVLVVQAMRSLTKQPACQAARRPGLIALSDPPIHEALSLMHARVEHAWTVAELAARVGLSRSGFAARFTELVGEPPLQYLARWRMARAAELLRASTDPVSTIATRVGYDSTPSFNKAFRRWQGTSPGDHRRAAAAIHGPAPSPKPGTFSPPSRRSSF